MRKFGELESSILETLWGLGRPSTVREVIDAVDGPPVAYTSAITVMERMRAKGWLVREQAGRAYRYRVVYGESDHIAHLMEQTLEGSADRSAVLLSFASRLDPTEVDKLRHALDSLDTAGREPAPEQPVRSGALDAAAKGGEG